MAILNKKLKTAFPRKRPNRDRWLAGAEYIGSRLREARTMRGMSQEDLAKRIGLTFQQVQKYEKGANRISATQLFDLAGIMELPITWFFEGLEENKLKGGALPTPPPRKHLELVRLFTRLPPAMQTSVYTFIGSLVRSMA